MYFKCIKKCEVFHFSNFFLSECHIIFLFDISKFWYSKFLEDQFYLKSGSQPNLFENLSLGVSSCNIKKDSNSIPSQPINRMDGKMELITCSTDGESEFLSTLVWSVLYMLITESYKINLISQRVPTCLAGHPGQLDGAERGAGDSPRALC